MNKETLEYLGKQGFREHEDHNTLVESVQLGKTLDFCFRKKQDTKSDL